MIETIVLYILIVVYEVLLCILIFISASLSLVLKLAVLLCHVDFGDLVANGLDFYFCHLLVKLCLALLQRVM